MLCLINGVPTGARDGQTILAKLRELGIEVPTLCHDDRLKPYGGCRLCVVELTGSGKVVSACTTPIADGMQIETHSNTVEQLRRTNLRMLAESYPDEPLDRSLEFHRYLLEYGVRPAGKSKGQFRESEHPYIQVDMSKCVHCQRCVRICDEVQGQMVWRIWNRGDRSEILPDAASLLESSCVSCGACADTCPTGAITDRAVLENGLPQEWVRTTCPYCGTGCELELGVREDRVIVARPSKASPVNKGHLCVKGRYAHAYVDAPDRVLSPMIRSEGEWQSVTWDEAFSFIATRLRRILDERGPEAVGVLGSSRATNEENFLAQKFARLVLGSNNVDCCARVCHAPTAAALKASFGTGAATNSFDDIELASGFLICGANPTENHPIVGARIKQQVRRGAKLVAIDPRQIELTRYADVHLQIRPGTNVPVLHAMANVIIGECLLNRDFVDTRAEGYEEYAALVREWTPERAGEIAGVGPELIREAARCYASANPAMIFHGLGMTEHTQGAEGVRCLANLALLTGNVGKPGSGENPLRGQNNVQGSAHMGCEPNHLAGYTPIEQAAEWVEQVWGAAIPRTKGLDWLQMSDSARAGDLKALWAIGYDVYQSSANSGATAEALRNLDLLIIQDLFLNETATEFGHVFLPACSTFEKDGTFMNSDRRVQRVRQAITVRGDSKPDWQIICGLAEAMGWGSSFSYECPEGIWEEVRTIWKPGSGISYERIEEKGIQWPCPTEDHPGTPILHRERFPLGDRAPFAMIEFRPTPEVIDAEYPFLLSTGRGLYQFNAGTMTMRTPNAKLRPTDTLDISPEDAGRLGFRDKQPVTIISRYGSATLPLHIDSRIKPGQLFCTFNDPRTMVNRLTGNNRDSKVGAPEYKVTAVKLSAYMPTPV